LYPEKLILVDCEKNPSSSFQGNGLNGISQTHHGRVENTDAAASCSSWNVDAIKAQILRSRPARVRRRFPFPSVFLAGRDVHQRGGSESNGPAWVLRSATINDDDCDVVHRRDDSKLLKEFFTTTTIFNLMFEGRKIKPGI
jgi:hypothetical protein